ncbi:hypothetical protein [Pseudomonas sp. dw_358]|uniref:hypothetical protein n=1 Tax=Pseudomonas sp. dw_358 TaxID=2720083 RepID=UPI001BD1ED6C|nr:hypothetical protein [Pseudomonas sp. dw_358]
MNKAILQAFLLCTALASTGVVAETSTWVELEISQNHVRLIDQRWQDIPLKASRLKQQAAAQGKVLAAQTPWVVQVLDVDDEVIDEIEIPDPLHIHTEFSEPDTAPARASGEENFRREEVTVEQGLVDFLVPHAGAAYRLRVIQRPAQGQITAVVSGTVSLRRMP